MNLLYKWIKQGVSLDKLDWILQRVYHHSDRIDKWPRKRFLTESRDKLTLLIGVWSVRVKVSGGSPMITSKARNWQKKRKDKIKKTGRRQPLITTKYDIQGTRNLFTGRNNKIICHKMLVKFQKCLDWVGQLIWGAGRIQWVKNAWEALFLMLNSNAETLIRWGRGLLLNMICG